MIAYIKKQPKVAKFSSLPKLRLGGSSNEALGPPLLIYYIANRVQVATFVVKQRIFWQKSSPGGNRPPKLL